MHPTNDPISEHIAKFKRKITVNRSQYWLSVPETPLDYQKVFGQIVESAFRINHISPMPPSHGELLTETAPRGNTTEALGYTKADLLNTRPSYLVLTHENTHELIKHGYFPRLLVNVRDDSLYGGILVNDIQAIIHGYKLLNDAYYAEIDSTRYDDIPKAMNRIFAAIQEVQNV